MNTYDITRSDLLVNPSMIQKVVFSSPWFDLVAKTMKEGQSPYYSLAMQDYVSILATTEEGDLLLVRQFRPAVEEYTVELPSGHVEKWETPEAAARRELLEETGYEVEALDFLGKLNPDTGRLGNKFWCFTASHLKKKTPVNLPEEGLELIHCRPTDLKTMMLEGRFNHALHLSMVAMALVKGKLSLF